MMLGTFDNSEKKQGQGEIPQCESALRLIHHSCLLQTTENNNSRVSSAGHLPPTPLHVQKNVVEMKDVIMAFHYWVPGVPYHQLSKK